MLLSLYSFFFGSGSSVAPAPPASPPPTPVQAITPTAVVTSDQMVNRLVRLLPARWWSTPAPTRDAILGGFGDVLSWSFSLLVYAKNQMRLSTATGFWIDIFSYDYLGLTTQRRSGESDVLYAARVKKELTRERVTRSGMIGALTDLTGRAPIINEPWLGSDIGGWSSRTLSIIIPCWGWSVGNAADQTRAGITSPSGGEIGQATGYSASWGTRSPNQVWITVFRPGSGQGIATVGGWTNRLASTNTTGGWSSRLTSTLYGAIRWVSRSEIAGAVTDQDIYDCINRTKPIGVTVWVQLI